MAAGILPGATMSMGIKPLEDYDSWDSLSHDLRAIAALGYEAVEFGTARPSHVDIGRLKTILTSAGLRVSGVGTGLAAVREGLSFTSLDGMVRETALARMREFSEFAGALNAPILVGLMQGTQKPGMELEWAMGAIADALKQSAEYASEYGTTVALEPVNRYESGYNNTVEEAIQTLSRVGSSRLSLILDTFHLNIEEVSIRDAISVGLPYLSHVHLSDSNRLAPGQGHIRFSEIMDVLRAGRYRGYLTIEIAPSAGIVTSARIARDHIMVDLKA